MSEFSDVRKRIAAIEEKLRDGPKPETMEEQQQQGHEHEHEHEQVQLFNTELEPEPEPLAKDRIDASPEPIEDEQNQQQQKQQQHETENDTEPRRNQKHVPWQLEWKNPRWTSSSPLGELQTNESADNGDDSTIVGLTTAQLAPEETSYILRYSQNLEEDSDSHGPRTDCHYLLSVTLLGCCSSASSTAPALASEVSIEVLEVPSSDSEEGGATDGATPTTSVLRSKRLRWPESIFDDAGAATTSVSSHTEFDRGAAKKAKPPKPKNFLASVFLPLIGIDEEDDHETAGHPQGQWPRPSPTNGIVSAALCRRPLDDGPTQMATKDVVDLMSFGGSGGMDPIGVAAGASGGGNERTGLPIEREREGSLDEHGAGSSTDAHGVQASTGGELSVACVSNKGEVFVYDPIKLLLGIEDNSPLSDSRPNSNSLERDAKRDLEEATSFFFGRELFQNLQESWKPLAEPSTRIHLSLFQHDWHQHREEKTNKTKTTTNNNDISTTSSLGSEAKNSRDDTTTEHLLHTNQELSDLAAQSGVGSCADSTSDASSSAVSSALDTVRTLASEWQSGIDDNLSMLPYLLNPLVEPATLRDRTICNSPLAIRVAGSSYVVVIGSGRKYARKDAEDGCNRRGFTKRRSRHRSNKSSDSCSQTPSVPPRDRSVDNDDVSLEGAAERSLSHSIEPNSSGAASKPKGGPETTEQRKDAASQSPMTVGYREDTDLPGISVTNLPDDGKNKAFDGTETATEDAIESSSAEQDEHKPYQPPYEATNPFAGTDIHSEKAAKPFESTNPFSESDEEDASPPRRINPFDDDVGDAQDFKMSPGPTPSWLDESESCDKEGMSASKESATNASIPENPMPWEVSSEKDSGAEINVGETGSSMFRSMVPKQNLKEESKLETETSDHGSRKNEDENSQRHFFDGYDEHPGEDQRREHGGFITFLTTSRWSETRTLFVPFVPLRVSHISKWNDMELLWVIGEFQSLLVRMDSTGPVPISIRDDLIVRRGNEEADLLQAATGSNLTELAGDFEFENELLPVSIKKFQILPVDQAVTSSIPPRLLCASSTGINPPCILELYTDPGSHSDPLNSFRDGSEAFQQPLHRSHHNQPALVLLKTLGYFTPRGTVVLRHAPSHVAKITISQSEMASNGDMSCVGDPIIDEASIWAEQGQGWSLLGTNRCKYFICWEGSTLLQGAYVNEFNNCMDLSAAKNISSADILPFSLTPKVRVQDVASSYFINGNDEQEQAFKNPQRFSSTASQMQVIDDFQLYQSNEAVGGPIDRAFFSMKGSIGRTKQLRRSTISSRRQHSEHLLQQCSSWTQLEETLDDRIRLERQAPVLCLRRGTAGSPHNVLSLRQLVVDNGTSSPFQQVLSWLAKRKNFFVAAGIALDLLQSADSLYHLWKHAEMINEEDEETKLLGLLDGISSVRLLDDNYKNTNECKHSVTATHLSEMTVGCFIKGGVSMANTLVQFLETNKLYDPARVSLMLSLTTINLFSNDSTTTRLSDSNQKEFNFDELLWPVECLLAIGTEREYLHEVLSLLNDTIPDELRHRQREEQEEGKEQIVWTPNMALTKKLIKMMLEADPVAIDILMSFVDDQSQVHFWQSLDHNTRLALSLMEIESSFPFLRQPEVRSWAREELDLSLRNKSNLPTIWLQELTLACLRNAHCDLDGLRISRSTDEDKALMSSSDTISERTRVNDNLCSKLATSDTEETSGSSRTDDFVETMNFEIERIRNSLLASNEAMCSLDFDLVIPTLLSLENHGFHWLPSTSTAILETPSSKLESSTCTTVMNKDIFTSTQALMNAACYLAGRASVSGSRAAWTSHVDSVDLNSGNEPFLFAAFDSKSAMKQCFIANNIVAGAYLVGGTNGFILHICDVLNRRTGISIPDAESYLVSDRLDLQLLEESRIDDIADKKPSSCFEVTSGHQKLLMLLDEHVLRIRTFGDFDFAHNRGNVDPVFAARSILRAWLLMSVGEKAAASNWLGEWLGDRLGIRCDRCRVPSPLVSPKASTPRSKISANGSAFEDADTFTSNRDDRGKHSDAANQDRYEEFGSASQHGFACASLARSLLWPNDLPTTAMSKQKDGGPPTNGADALPLADAMQFETKLLLELCQSCLGLVESVPPSMVEM